MRSRVLPLCLLLGLTLAAFLGGATFGQKPTDFPPDTKNAARPPALDTTSILGTRQTQPAPTSKGVPGLLGDDPLAAAEKYLEKTSQEVAEAIEVLGKEADALRTRLEKVEAAHRRLNGVLGGLQAPVPMPGTADEKPAQDEKN